MAQPASSASAGPSVSAAGSLSPVVPGWEHHSSDKIRDVYIPTPDGPQDGQDVFLVVTLDRINAHNHTLATPIPDKGRVLTALSVRWFEQLTGVAPNYPVSPDVLVQAAGHVMICQRLEVYPVECMAHGYLVGSGLAGHQQGRSVYGVAPLEGLIGTSRLPKPTFTSAAKTELGEHDENVTFERVIQVVGDGAAAVLRETTLALCPRVAEVARDRGIILADTELEFGTDADGDLALGDKVLTPDSSRFWLVDAWEPGRIAPPPSKQYVRDWLTSPASNWDRGNGQEPLVLSDDVVERTRARYLEAYERLTGHPLELS